MKETLFRVWAHPTYGLAGRTISARVYNCKWVEMNAGDLDTGFERDGCTSMLATLSDCDGISYRLAHLINGDAYTNFATYRSPVNLYIKFRTWLVHNLVESFNNESVMKDEESVVPQWDPSSNGLTCTIQPNAIQTDRGEITILRRTYTDAPNVLVGALGRSTNVLGELSELLIA